MKSQLAAILFSAGAFLSLTNFPAQGADKPAFKDPPLVHEEHWDGGKLLKSKTETTADGVKTVVHFDHDGTTQLLKQEFRKDGTLAYQKHRMLDGSTLAVRYKSGGQPQMERAHNPKTGEFTLKHYRVGKSTEVWFRSEMNLTAEAQTWYYFAKNGTTVKRVIDGDKMTVTVSDAAGKVEYHQHWEKKKGAWTLSSATDPAGNQQQAPAKWLVEFDPSDDPTIPE